MSWLAISLATFCGLAANAQPDSRLLWQDPDRFTPTVACSEGLVIAGADITSIRNGTGSDGSVHFPGLFQLDFAVDAGNDASGIRAVGGRVHAPSGRVSLTEVDLSLPCAGPAWTIARSYASGVQDTGGARVSAGYQGNNWFASAHPVLSPCTSGTNQIDKLALVYGADRELRFTRITDGPAAGVFRATDGAAGAIVPVFDNSIEYYDYHDASGNVARFMGPTATATAPAWHLVSITDAAGASASVQYASGLPSVATDSAGRTFTYSYSSATGSPRLASVIVHDPSTAEIARVEYTYAGASDARGLPGDLISVRTRIPVSDQSHTIDRDWHYRYYTTAADAGRIFAKVDPEGAKRAEEDQLDPSLAPAAFRDSTFTYDAAGRVATATVREMPGATLRLSYTSRTGAPGYDPTWHFATTIHTDTDDCNDLSETLYFDEAEQPLGSFAFDADPTNGTHIGESGLGAKILAASWQERNADGIVTRLRDGANLSQYIHLATNGQVFIPDSALGLVVDRSLITSGLYTGFESHVARRVGDASTSTTIVSSVTYRDLEDGEGGETIDGYLVASPLIESTTRYPIASSVGETTTHTYTFHNDHGLAIKTLTITDPIVVLAQNGDGSTNSVSYYFDLSGRQRFERSRSGRIHVWDYHPTTGQLERFVWDAAASQVNGNLPSGFGVTGLASELMRREWTYSYDPQGRRESQIAPDGRTSITRVSTFADGRPLVYSVPRVDGISGESASYFGPVSFAKLDLEGGVLESVDIGPKLERAAAGSGFNVTLTTERSSSEPSSWISSTATSLVESVASGFERANLVTRDYDPTGTFREETRVYTKLAEVALSPSPLIARNVSTHPFDLTRHGYDCAGRPKWTRKPDGTVYTATRDPLGRTTEVWRGFADGEHDPASPTQPYKLASLEYDQGDYALLNRLTSLTLYPGGNEPNRQTLFYYDAQGDVTAVKNPVAPHAVYRRDRLGRVVRRSLFGGDGAFLDAPDFDPTLDRVADRQLVNDTFFDPMGRVYRSARYAINSDGTSDSARTLPTDFFYGKEGSLRLRSGTSVTEYGYNRACEICRIRALSTSANGLEIPSIQTFLDSVYVLEDTRLLRDRATGRLIGEINALRDVGRSPYDQTRTIAGAPGVLIQESSIQWNEQGSQFTFSIPTLYASGSGFDFRFSARTYEYDVLGRVAATINHGDPRMDNSFAAISGGGMSELDAAALALSLIQGDDTDNAPRANLFAYDGLNRALATIGPDGSSRSFQYDALGRTVSDLGGSLNSTSSPGANGPNGPELGMLVIDSCPNESGKEYGYDEDKIIWQRAIIPGDPNYPNIPPRFPEEHWFYKDYELYPSGTMPGPDVPPNLPPWPRELIICRAIIDDVPANWQDLELLTPDFREATTFSYNALGETIGFGTLGGTGFSIHRDPAGRPIALNPAIDPSFNSGPTPSIDVPGSLGVRWEYDSLGRLRRTYQVQPGGSTPILDIENTFGNLGELLSQKTTDATNPDASWSGIGPMPVSEVQHFYSFPSQSQVDALRRLGLEGTLFPGGLGMKIDFDNSPEDQNLARPRRAIYGTWTNGNFVTPTVAGQPVDTQLWRGAYHGIVLPAWDELPKHPLLDELRTVRDYGPALGMALIAFPRDPGSNRFGELTRDWIHQPICAGISCNYPGSELDPLSTPFGNDDTITRGRDGTTRTTLSDVPTSRDLTYQPLTCGPSGSGEPTENLLNDDIFSGPIGTLVVRRGNDATASQSDPVRVEHLVRDASGGLRKHVIEQNTGSGREVLSVYEAVFSSSNRLVAYATKTPPESTHWEQMPADLDPVADESIIVRPEYDLRGNLIQDQDNQGRPRRFTYDAFNRLTAVHIDHGQIVNNEHVADWRILSKYRYDALGRRVAAIYNRNNTTTLNDDFVEFYGYDQSWRLTTVWRQAAADENGARPAPVIYERFLHNPGWGSRLDAPLMSQVNDNWDQVDELGAPIEPIWDGPDSHRRTFIQDAFGNVIAVRDNTLQRDTVRISYSPTGEPILDSHYSGADFDRNGGVDGADLGAFLPAFEQGDESADLDQNGAVDGGDLALFFEWLEAGFAGDHTLDAQRFLYRGYHWDDTLKMYHVRYRVYDPARMLWIQRDPLGRLPGDNEYAYCLGEPVDFYDPMGLERTQPGMDNSDLYDKLRPVRGDPDTNMGATPAQKQIEREEAERANRWFNALGEALVALTPVVGDLAEVREINADPNRSTLNKVANTSGVILIGFVPPAKGAKVAIKILKAADKVDDAADAAKTLDRVSDAADAAKDGEKAKDAAKAADKVSDTGECAKTASGAVKFKKWERGQRIDKPMPDGSEPDWDTVRSRYWKNRYEAAKDTGEFSKENLRLMNKGQAPLDYNPRTGEFESRELHHVKPQRDGGSHSPENLREVTPDQHRALDEYRR
jgi:RHS repeat-associated protein